MSSDAGCLGEHWTWSAGQGNGAAVSHALGCGEDPGGGGSHALGGGEDPGDGVRGGLHGGSGRGMVCAHPGQWGEC